MSNKNKNGQTGGGYSTTAKLTFVFTIFATAIGSGIYKHKTTDNPLNEPPVQRVTRMTCENIEDCYGQVKNGLTQYFNNPSPQY